MKMFSSFKPYPGIYNKLPISDTCIILTLLAIICMQVFFLCYKVSEKFHGETVIRHGEIHEGIVGVPAHKNPLYATNTAEKDIATLMHAGLLKHNNEGGFIPHLAATWEQKDKNRHLFTLKENISFHDGAPVTAKDVIHTIGMLHEGADGPHHSKWVGVEASKIDDLTIQIIVPEGNTSFPESFTVPILPEHVWKKIPKEKQKRYKGPGVYIGAGPYRLSQETVTLDEQPTQIILTEFSGYALGRPFIKKIVLHFFVDTKNLVQAYASGIIDGVHGVTATELITLLEQRNKKADKIYTANTTRVFGVFFNAEDGRILQDSFLRNVLSRWVDRKQITAEVFKNHADPIQAPLAADTEIEESDMSLEELRETLEDIGWKFEAATGKRERDGIPLEITFIILDTEETETIAEILLAGWRHMGVSVKTEILKEEEMSKAIRKGRFDAMLYGYQANSPKDLITLWKSENTENLASITRFGSTALNNLLTDLEKNTPPKRYEKELSNTPNDNWQMMVYNEIKVEMEKNVPAIFLYSPHFLYILPEDIKGIGLNKEHLGRVYDASNRFLNVHNWHIKKERVWKFLAKK